MNQRLTLVFLILLRTAIGWHFFFEALEKHYSVNIGPSEISRPWSGEGYFREGRGPVAALMRLKLGDLDEQALARMTVRTAAYDEPISKRLPEALDAEWNDYFERFAKHYGLDAQQRQSAQAKLLEQKEKTAVWFIAKVPSYKWLVYGLWTDFDHKPFKRTYPTGTIDIEMTVSQRVDEYRSKLQEYREFQSDKPSAMGKDVERTRRAAARADLIALRTELTDLVNGRTTLMKQALAAELTAEQAANGAVLEPGGIRFIKVVDYATRWGLTLIGVGLMLGLFSRTSAAAGAMFLLLTILTTPSLPWLPAPPMSEGNYVFVSKNVIEMLALVMLACIPSGRWFGVDALLHAVNPWRKKDQDNKGLKK